MIVIDLPFPPSVNAYWRHLSKGPLAGRTLISEDGRKYRAAVEQAVVLQRVRGVGTARVAVSVEVRAPDRRRRDLDNLGKSLLDALSHAGVWQDDEQIDDLRFWRSERGGGRVIVKIDVLPQAQPELLGDACQS